MNKINFIKQLKQENIEKKIMKKQNFKNIEDKLTLSQSSSKIVEAMTEELFLKDYTKLISGLQKEYGWNNSVEFATFNKNENDKLLNISIGIFNLKKGNNDLTVMSINDFIEVMTNVTAKQINFHPEKESEYKKMYLDLLDYINKNKA